jgi:hypothetical protein
MAEVAHERPVWSRPALTTAGSLVALSAVLAAYRLPVDDPTVWLEAVTVATSAVVLIAVTWWLTGRPADPDRRVVLRWGLGSGLVLGCLWTAEIAFNNLTPHAVSTGAVRSVVDNVTWVTVGVFTVVATIAVTLHTRRWRSGLRAGVWSGVGSGLGAAAGGAVLLAFLRPYVERDPLMRIEWQQRNPGTGLATYVTRETLAGVGGHLWMVGIAQGALLGLLAALLTTAAIRVRTVAGRSRAFSDAG